MFVVLGFVVLRDRNHSVVMTLQWAGNRNKIDTARYSLFEFSTSRGVQVEAGKNAAEQQQ